MSGWQAVRCRGCGGAISALEGTLPACLFCGASALDPIEPEGIEAPEGGIPFACDSAAAQAAFKTFAGSSIWYPGDLRSARLKLKPLMLPAWAWSGELETHWTGLVRASSASGKRPVGGTETARFDQILIPASESLRQAELAALGAYDESELLPEPDPEVPREVSQLTRSVARERAQDEMARRHHAQLDSAHGTSTFKGASVTLELSGRPVLVPVWIGAYRYGDKVYRVLLNGQTGQLHGDAPISWWRVAFAIVAVCAVVGFLALAFTVCTGGVALVSSG